jgi:ketosteroid isomerase-like protein
MTANDDAMAVVRAYYRAWTTKNFDAAARLLSPDLRVEVPINEYPTGESFAKAVATFGALVKDVALLAEFGGVDEAILLYDMDVEKVGALRVAEHFVVKAGRITHIRQVHDTAAVRAAGFAQGR